MAPEGTATAHVIALARLSSYHEGMTTWKLADAKNRFSEVVERALAEGPQMVSRRGVAAVVVVSAEQFNRTRARRGSFKDYLRSAPLAGLNLKRSPSRGREVTL